VEKITSYGLNFYTKIFCFFYIKTLENGIYLFHQKITDLSGSFLPIGEETICHSEEA